MEVNNFCTQGHEDLQSPGVEKFGNPVPLIFQIFEKIIECVWTCYDLPQFGVQVDSAGQKHLHVSGGENRCPRGEEDLKASDISIDL